MGETRRENGNTKEWAQKAIYSWTYRSDDPAMQDWLHSTTVTKHLQYSRGWLEAGITLSKGKNGRKQFFPR
jgi:hypothetical protein